MYHFHYHSPSQTNLKSLISPLLSAPHSLCSLHGDALSFVLSTTSTATLLIQEVIISGSASQGPAISSLYISSLHQQLTLTSQPNYPRTSVSLYYPSSSKPSMAPIFLSPLDMPGHFLGELFRTKLLGSLTWQREMPKDVSFPSSSFTRGQILKLSSY